MSLAGIIPPQQFTKFYYMEQRQNECSYAKAKIENALQTVT